MEYDQTLTIIEPWIAWPVAASISYCHVSVALSAFFLLWAKHGIATPTAINENIIVKSGAWFAYNDAKIGQGRENAKLYLKENPEVMAEVENKVREKYGLPVSGTKDGAEE